MTTTANTVAIAVTNLLAHYWLESEHALARRQIIRDWIDDLIEFAPDIVKDACGEWRRTERRRPMIADIRALCIPVHNKRAQERALAAPSSLSEAEKYARSVGWASNAERRDALIRSEAKLGTNRDTLAEGKAIGNRWAQERGFPTLDAYAEANGLDYVSARMQVVRFFLAQVKKPPGAQKPAEQPYSTPERSIHDVLREMGITSTRTAE
jgi:hypothetical protein